MRGWADSYCGGGGGGGGGEEVETQGEKTAGSCQR